MKRFWNIVLWIFFWPVRLPIWLSYRFPTWLRWLYWFLSILFLVAAVSSRQNGAPVGAFMVINLLGIFLFGVVKIITLLFGKKTVTPSLVDLPKVAAPPVVVPTKPANGSGGLTDLHHLDNLDGIEFEHVVAGLLSSRGYQTEVTKASGDYGVDVIATKDGVRFAVQVKRYTGNVSLPAVSEAVAGARHWRCHASMVVTNSYFTSAAKKLAETNGCVLIDRDMLAQWLTDRRIQKVTP